MGNQLISSDRARLMRNHVRIEIDQQLCGCSPNDDMLFECLFAEPHDTGFATSCNVREVVLEQVVEKEAVATALIHAGDVMPYVLSINLALPSWPNVCGVFCQVCRAYLYGA